MALLVLWPTVTDDSGLKTDGTLFNKALTDAIRASVEDNVHSLNNAAIKTKDLIDEVVTARGALASLNARFAVAIDANGNITEVVNARGSMGSLTARLDVALNADGTPKNTGLVARLTTISTAVGNIGAGTDDLMTYAVPAGKLASNGQALRVTCSGTFAANANAKSILINFGATSATIFNAVVANGIGWSVTFFITRTGAATQLFDGTGAAAGMTASSPSTTSAETLANSITLKLTAIGTADNDIVQNRMIVEFLG